ncbi:MAG: response regulator transcription factor [Balneolaceae bacterium]
MTKSSALQRGREAFRHRSWADAYSCFVSADGEESLDAEDLELLAKAAYLIGKESGCTETWMRAHQKFLNEANTERAANSAFWIGMLLFFRGEHAQGSGWIARAARLINEYQQECAEMGFLLIPEGLQFLRKGEAEAAQEKFSMAGDIGKRFNNPDLIILGYLGHGQSLIKQNKIAEGTTLFDEAMVAVVSDEISQIVAGIVYCAVIETCQNIYDLQRASEWTDALSRWCNAQPDLIPYRGQCLVRRAEIMQLHGKWPDAMNEARRACELKRPSSPPVTGEAFYRQAELYRLQGNFSEAGNAYKQASNLGRNPQPGLALMQLGQGKTEVARMAICNAEGETQDRMARARILPAYVEIMLASEEVQAAEAGAKELSDIASEVNAPYLRGVAAGVMGSVLLANEKPAEAIKKLRWSLGILKTMDSSYEAARTQVLIGLACRKLEDENTTTMEFDAARKVFQQLGAIPDQLKVDSLLQRTQSAETSGLTSREREVLRILATGKTNKDIAGDLFISERTVDRHVSNILAKLNVSSRAAATAFAYKNNLI